MRQGQGKLKCAETTQAIIGALFEVYNDLGQGFLESVYERALAVILREKGHRVERQWLIKVYYRGGEIGHFRADLLVNDEVIVEIKASGRLHSRNSAQLTNVMRAMTIEVGLLLNFGPTPEFKRILMTNDRKRHIPLPSDAASSLRDQPVSVNIRGEAGPGTAKD